MVTFNSNNPLVKNPKKRKKRSKKGSGTLGAGQVKGTLGTPGQGVKPKGKNKPKPIKHAPDGTHAWSDLRVGEKIKSIVSGNGRNSVLPNGKPTWTDGNPKPIKSNIPRARGGGRHKNTINPIPAKPVKPIKTNPNWRQIQIDKKKDKIPVQISRIDNFIEQNTKIPETLYTTDENDNQIQVNPDEGYINIRTLPDTGDEGLNNLIIEELNLDEDIKKYTSTDRKKEFEELQQKGTFDTQEEEDLFMSEGEDEFVKVSDFKNKIDEIINTKNPDTDIDPDFDIITLDEIESYDPKLSQDIQDSVPKVTVDGSTVPKEAKLIGIKFKGEENIKQEVMIPEYNYDVPVWENGVQTWKLENKPATFEYNISQEDEGVFATEDGRTFLAPINFSEFIPSDEYGGGFEVPSDLSKYEPTDFEKQTFMDVQTGLYTDNIFKPSLDLLLDDDDNIINNEDLDCDQSKKIVDSAIDNLANTFSKTMMSEKVDFNNSEFKSYGFYIEGNRLYANVAFDDFGLPKTEDITGNLYTGGILNTDGSLAESIPIGSWSSDAVAAGFGGMPAIKAPEEDDLKYTFPPSDLGVDTPRYKSFASDPGENVKKWMKKNAACYNVKNDQSANQQLQDLADKLTDLQEKYTKAQEDLVNNPVSKELADVTNKNRVISATMEAALSAKANSINDDVKLVNKLKEKYESSPNEKLRNEVNDRIDLIEKEKANYKKILEDYNNIPLSDYSIRYLDSQGNDIYLDNSSWDDATAMLGKGDIETTILTAPNDNIQFAFPKSDLYANGGIPPIVAESVNKLDFKDLTMPNAAIENSAKLIDLQDQFSKEKEKQDYVTELYNMYMAQIPGAMLAAQKENEEVLQALKDKDTTWSQSLAWGFNRIMGNIIKILPGIAELALLVNEAGTRVVKAIVEEGEDFFDTDLGSELLNTYADTVHELSDKIAKETEKVLDEASIKPGGTLEPFDLAKQDIENSFTGKTAGLLIDIVMDIIGSKGLSAAGRASRITKGVDWATEPTTRRLISNTNSTIIDAYKAGKISKRGLATLIITENMPVTIMARLVQDGVAETNALIDQWMEANPGKEFPLDAGDLLVLELIKPVIESSLDKIGIDFIAGKGVMPKLSVWITNRVITKKPKSVSLREFVNQQIKALRDGGLIKGGASTLFNVADEVVQEEINMLIELSADDKIKKAGAENGMYGTTAFGTEEHMGRLMDVVGPSLIGIGILEGTIGKVNYNINKKRINNQYQTTKNDFLDMVKLKEKPIKDQVIEAIELQMNTDIADTKKRTDLDSKQKEEAIQQIQETANKDKANVKNIHDIMQKVDATLGIDYALTQFNLELQKFTINEQLDKTQPDNVKEELENQLNEVEQDLTNLTNTILNEEGDVKEEFVSEAAQEFDTKADEFLEKMKDSGADVIIAETAEDAEAIANSYGVSMQGQAAKFIRLPNGDRKLLFSKESALNNARINNGVVKLDFDHEGDHFFIDELEQMTGDSEITLQIGEDIDNAIANGDIVFKNKKAEKEFQDLMDQYANRNPNDPVALADETIANMRQFMDEGKASFKKPIYDKIKQSIKNFVGKATDNTIEIDVENNGELLKILDLMREGETEQVAEVIEKAKTKRKPRKTPPSILEPIGQSEDQAKERLALDDNVKEKKDLIEKIKKLVADGKAKNKTEIEKAQQRLVVLNRGIANAEDVAIIEDPKSSASAKQAAENRLIKRNQEPIVEDLLNKKMSGDVYYGTITLRDGSQIKAQVPRSEIKEALMGEEFTKIYKKFFTRDASLKDVPIGFKLMNDLAFRWQQVVDPLVEKYAREQRDRQEDEGISYFETTPDFNDDGIINDIDKEIAKDDDAVINMRQAIGILPGSDIFNKVKEGVVNTFKGKLPDIESGDLKKALLDSFAIQGADAVRLLIDEMGGVEPFLTTYGEQVYDLIPQSIMNKSFQDFIIQGKRLGVEETRDAQSKGLISKQKTKKGKKETSGYFLYEKEKYDKDKWIKYHTDPKSVGAKGTKYSKKNQLVDVIAKSLGADAAMEVMSQPDMMEMYNERNKLLSQTEVLVEDIGNILEKDPKARFALNISADRIPYIQKQIIGAITRAYDTAVKGMDFAADMLDEEFSLLPEELLKAFPDTFERIKQLFNTSATGFKKKLKQDIETADIPENYKELAREVNETQTQSKGKGVPSSMAQMHAFGKKVIGKINLDVIKNLKGANFFSYIYGYLDGGDKSKGKGTKFGDYKSELDEVNKIISKLKNNDELDFDPKDIRLLNATSGILQKAEKILNEDYTEKGGREAKLKELGFDPNTGEVKPGSIMDQLQKANEANIKAIDYIMRKSAISISEDNSLIPGFLRWLESMTNNTKSLRALSRLANMEVSAKPQAAYYNPETDSYENSLSAAQKKSGEWVANYNHPRYEEAEKMAKQKTDDPIEQQKIIAQKLNYKGEHIDVASNLYAKLGIQVLETAAKLENAKSDKEKEGILESLSNKNTLALMKYDQAHTTKVEADQIDAKTSTTDATDYIRMKSDFVLKATPDKIVVSDPTMDPSQDIDSKIVSEQELIDAVENSIEDTQKVKERNAERLEDSGVAGMEGDLTGPEVLGKMATLDDVLTKARTGKYPKKRKKIRVFDFDDTLAETNSKVFYTMPDGTEGILTAEEFAKKGEAIRDAGGEFDFSDFNRVVDPQRGPMIELFKKMYEAEGERDLFILTARAPESAPAIQAWLRSEGFDLPLEKIIGLGNSSPQAKAEWFIGKAADGYNDFYFSDDAPQNVEAVQDVLDVIDVKSQVQIAKERFALNGEKIANRLFKMVAAKNKKLTEDALRNISDVKAQIKGDKVRENILAMSSTENFTGLLYKFLGRGQEGNDDWKFLQDNLVRPYTRALNELAAYKNTLIADFNTLLSNFVGADKPIKSLTDQVPGLGGYTYEDAIRILAWDKQGLAAEGVPKTTLDKIRALGNSNLAISRMAEQLNVISKGDDHYYPGKDWRAGTIMSDLMLGLNKVKRPQVLAEWNQNIETIFGTDNGSNFNGQMMNAIQATYGTKYREAFEDMLRRMKTGQNRRTGNSKLENRFYDWLNNSVGAVMFFNMRSGLLQTLSAANYINWTFNNPAQAAKAFANQPQYWRDFMTLFNSDFLVDRRGGMKINISESEIFDIRNSKGNKAKEFLNLLIRKGFSITQIADSFAIASGGATYYRNRIKNLVSEGMSNEEAEAQAYEEWTALSREAQQSSDAMEISSQQAGGLGRVILAFANTPMQYNRLISKAISDLTNGRGDWKTNVSRIAYYSAIQNMMFNALQQAIFAAIGNDDPEDLDERTIATLDGMLTSLLRGMGVAGSIMSAIKDVGLDLYDRATDEEKPRPEYYKSVFEALNVAPPLDVKVSKFVRAMNTLEYNMDSPAMKDPFDIENPLYMSAALLTASVTNVPLDRMLQKMINVKDAFTEEQETWKSVFELMGWSEWQLESKAESEARQEKQSDEKHYYRAIEKPSLYNKAEQEDILRQHGFTAEQIKSLKTQDQRVTAILTAQASSGKIYTSKIPNVKSDELKEIKAIEPIPVPKKIEKPKPTPQKVKADTTPKPKKVNFTENTSFKNHRVPVDKRNADEIKLYELPAAEQRDSLRSLGLSDKEIKALKYEGDRVRKILELQK